MATLVSQGNYNQNTGSFGIATLTDTEWASGPLATTTLNPFDGYWVYINAAKSFDVISD